ncbi:ABC transporter substrate-binding protein [Albimonas pacifica]|uniref:Peptide/nickel transport system substrate-binding protein n=1 Tax=Albimonas pacifica TaxID=1114924 RepID=A0A1I3J220_9RHOB|nr:ABC transporter substrate-binding protein [Albimonas pacifica]SFI54250.1 peptide/nickel transport system substrate-binding protein [Albimonas pacifica]
MTPSALLAATASALALALAFAAPASAAGTARIGLQQEPTVLDPTADATASIDGMLAQNVFESLTTVNEAGEVLPNLAERWEIADDGLTYTFHLVEGASFHDGTAFDAQDVKFSFDRAMAEDSVNPSKSIWAPIASVEVLDPATVRLTLTRKDAFLLFNLAQGDASILAPESADRAKTEPVGTGPFRFVSWTRGDRLVLAKNADWRDAEAVSLDRVEFRFIADPASGAAALMADELDAFPGFGAPEMLPQFEADPRFAVTVGSTEGEVILAMNNARAPFDDPRVRQAVNHAIDRDAIIDGAMYGRAAPIGSFYPPHGPAYLDLTGTWPHDVEKARALFEAAGVAGREMTLRVPPFAYATRSAEIIQAQLAAAGVDAKVETVEWGFWIGEVYKNRNYDMTIIAHTSPNDMGNFARGKDYFYGYQDDAYDALWAAIETEADAQARAELQREAQRFLAEAAVHAFLFQLPKLSVVKAGLEGFWASSPVIFQPLAGVRWAD